MDPRIQEHARTIVDHSASIESGDDVLVRGPLLAEDLVVALYGEIGKRGANPVSLGGSERATRSYLRAADPGSFTLPEHIFAAIDAADVVIQIKASRNTHEQSDVAATTFTAYQQSLAEIQDLMAEKRWVLTQHPAPGNAQDAEMSTDAYADFVYAAVNKDWDAQAALQEPMVDILDDGSEVQVTSGAETDLRMRIGGMRAENDIGTKNLPGGEVFTSPVPDSVEGTVLFDKPLIAQGREVTNVRLEFEAGEVVSYSAEKNEEVLEAVVETDEGARRVGELGIGMNRDIDRFTYNMLFDEKMGDTIHLALGRAFDETVGPDREKNESAVHMDMIVDMSEESSIEVDGEVVQRNGTFAFEDGFEA